VTFADGRPPAFPGSAHLNLNTALEDAFSWASRGHDVYWAMGGQAKTGDHYNGRPYPSAIRQRRNTVACRCLYVDIDVKPDEPETAYPSTREAANTKGHSG